MDCLRYVAMSRPRWRKPRSYAKPVNYAVAAMRKKLQNKRDKGGPSGVRLGPAA